MCVERGMSQRRACSLIGIARSSLRYESRMDAKDAPVIERMCEVSARYPRYGYRRIRVFLGRLGLAMSPSRCHRIWHKAGLQVPRKRCRKRPSTRRPRPKTPTRANEMWAYDFVFDACANGQKLKCLTIIDEWTREALAIEVSGSIRSEDIIVVLAKLISVRGAPTYLRSDNGPEFVSAAIEEWLEKQGVETTHIEPGKPWQNGMNESFNGKFRDECLGMEWFRTRAEAKVIIEIWRREYNEIRPHQGLGYLTPNEFVKINQPSEYQHLTEATL